MSDDMTRRDVLNRIAIAGAAAASATVSTTGSAAPATNPTSAAVTTQPAAPPPEDGAITAEDVAAADRVAGRDHHAPAEREMMAKSLVETRDRLRRVRARPIPPEVEPAVRFDPRVPGMSPPPGPSSCVVSDAPLRDYDGDPRSLAFATVAELSWLIHAKKVTSVELARMYLERLKTIGPRLNCVVTLTEDLALAQAERADRELAAGKNRGPLHGIPWGAKDMLATRGVPTTWGAAPYKDQVFDDDATVVKRLDAAGAVLCAKLSLGELAMGDVWFNGLTRNPWQPDKGSSGSSAGPAAATAAGLVAFTIGSETLGSIVSPCQTCGTTGLRPTYGRVSRFGAMPLARTMDKLGPITRGVEDAALVLSAIHGADHLDPTAAADVPFRWDPALDVKTLRVAYDPRAFDFEQDFYRKNPKLREFFEPVFDQLRSLLGELRPIQLPPPEPYTGLAGLTIACESAASFTELLTSGRVRELKQQGPGSWPNAFRVGSTIPASDYLRAQQVRTQLQRAMTDAMHDLDAYVSLPYVGPTVAFTNLTGHPSLVTRAGMLDGRPRTIEFVGNLYREDAICALGHAFERATNSGAGGAPAWPDTDKIPPLAQS